MIRAPENVGIATRKIQSGKRVEYRIINYDVNPKFNLLSCGTIPSEAASSIDK
jgi:hypothetical protein